MGQATTTRGDGTRVYRWYVFESDGHRIVTWAETAEAAIQKIQRLGKLGPDASVETVRVLPAPPLGTD